MRNRGFSLMEMLIALAVLLIALSSMFGIFFQGSKYLAKLKTALPAYTVARSELEAYFSWDALDILDDNDDNIVTDGEYNYTTNATQFPLVNLTLFNKADAPTAYRVGISIANVFNTTGVAIYGNRLKRVRVSVSWFDGKDRIFNLTTIKTDY